MPRARPLAEEDSPASRAVRASAVSAQDELLALTALRGVAALWVLLSHVRPRVLAILERGRSLGPRAGG